MGSSLGYRTSQPVSPGAASRRWKEPKSLSGLPQPPVARMTSTVDHANERDHIGQHLIEDHIRKRSTRARRSSRRRAGNARGSRRMFAIATRQIPTPGAAPVRPGAAPGLHESVDGLLARFGKEDNASSRFADDHLGPHVFPIVSDGALLMSWWSRQSSSSSTSGVRAIVRAQALPELVDELELLVGRQASEIERGLDHIGICTGLLDDASPHEPGGRGSADRGSHRSTPGGRRGHRPTQNLRDDLRLGVGVILRVCQVGRRARASSARRARSSAFVEPVSKAIMRSISTQPVENTCTRARPWAL